MTIFRREGELIPNGAVVTQARRLFFRHRFSVMMLAIGNIFLAFGVSLGFVSVYYLLRIVASVVVQKVFHYDKPNGVFYKIIDAPLALAELLFDLVVPESIRRQHFRGSKRKYLNRVALGFILNVVLYSFPAYLALFGILK